MRPSGESFSSYSRDLFMRQGPFTDHSGTDTAKSKAELFIAIAQGQPLKPHRLVIVNPTCENGVIDEKLAKVVPGSILYDKVISNLRHPLTQDVILAPEDHAIWSVVKLKPKENRFVGAPQLTVVA